tara:strand:+ start:68 stop:688 length:621 start_codon:yes stop_codon:yes gene_type:complete
MKQLIYIFTFLIIGNIAKSTTVKNDFHLIFKTSIQQDSLKQLEKIKTELDTLFKHNIDNLIILAKISNQDNLVLVKNGEFPENTETTFNILKNKAGQIVSISEIPTSESGDWYIVYSYYFDNNGKTFAFERQTNFFNSLCTNGVAYETKTDFYDKNFNLLKSFYKLTNDKNENLRKEDCIFYYDFKYKIIPNLKEYLELKKINNGR